MKGISHRKRNEVATALLSAEVGTHLVIKGPFFSDDIPGLVFMKCVNINSPHLNWMLMDGSNYCSNSWGIVKYTVGRAWWLS